MTLCQRVSPCGLASEQGGGSSGMPAAKISLWFSAVSGSVAPLMSSGCAWLEISERFSPLWEKGEMFCFWTQMGFSHWHEPGLIAWPTHRCDGATSRFLILISSVMYNYARNCQPDLFAWYTCRDRRQRGPHGNFALNASINMRRRLIQLPEEFAELWYPYCTVASNEISRLTHVLNAGIFKVFNH